MSRETLKDFLNSRGSSADSISVTLSEKPDGLGVEPNTGEELLDLVNDAKGLLGDYVKHLVDMSDNEYKRYRTSNTKAFLGKQQVCKCR